MRSTRNSERHKPAPDAMPGDRAKRMWCDAVMSDERVMALMWATPVVMALPQRLEYVIGRRINVPALAQQTGASHQGVADVIAKLVELKALSESRGVEPIYRLNAKYLDGYQEYSGKRPGRAPRPPRSPMA